MFIPPCIRVIISYDVVHIDISQLHHVCKEGNIIKTFYWNYLLQQTYSQLHLYIVCNDYRYALRLIKYFAFISCSWIAQAYAWKWDVIYLLRVHCLLFNWSISGIEIYIRLHISTIVSASTNFSLALAMTWDIFGRLLSVLRWVLLSSSCVIVLLYS